MSGSSSRPRPKKGGRVLDVLLREVAVNELAVDVHEVRAQRDAFSQVLLGQGAPALYPADDAQPVMVRNAFRVFLDQPLHMPGGVESGGRSGRFRRLLQGLK